jgi:hypothetical protein
MKECCCQKKLGHFWIFVFGGLDLTLVLLLRSPPYDMNPKEKVYRIFKHLAIYDYIFMGILTSVEATS